MFLRNRFDAQTGFVACASNVGKPITMLSFLAVKQSLATEENIAELLDILLPIRPTSSPAVMNFPFIHDLSVFQNIEIIMLRGGQTRMIC